MARFQHSHGVGTNHTRRDHAIMKFAFKRGDNNYVAISNVSEGPEERVAVSAESKIARPSRQRRSRNVAHRATKGLCVVSFHEHYGKSKTRNFKAANQAFRGNGRGAWNSRDLLQAI